MQFYVAGICMVDLFCSCDLELDPMTFIYELDLYSLVIYQMSKYELPRYPFKSYCLTDITLENYL